MQQQTSENDIQALNLINVSDLASARDSGLQVALALEREAVNVDCTQVPITEAVDFCSSLDPSKPKAKSTRKRKANKESCVTGRKASFSDAKGNAVGKEGPAGYTSEKEGTGVDAS